MYSVLHTVTYILWCVHFFVVLVFGLQFTGSPSIFKLSIHPMLARCRRLGLDPGPVEGDPSWEAPWNLKTFVKKSSTFRTKNVFLCTLVRTSEHDPQRLAYRVSFCVCGDGWIFVGRPGQSRQRRLELRQAGLRWNHMFGRVTSLWNRWRRKQRQSFQVPKAKLQMQMAGASNCGKNRFVAKSFQRNFATKLHSLHSLCSCHLGSFEECSWLFQWDSGASQSSLVLWTENLTAEQKSFMNIYLLVERDVASVWLPHD